MQFSTPMSPGLPALTYKHNQFNLLLSSACLSNFTEEVMGAPCPEAVLIVQPLLQPLLLCEQGQVRATSERKQERDSKAETEGDRSALLFSAPRGEKAHLQILRQKLSWQNDWTVMSCPVMFPPPQVHFVNGCRAVLHLKISKGRVVHRKECVTDMLLQ